MRFTVGCSARFISCSLIVVYAIEGLIKQNRLLGIRRGLTDTHNWTQTRPTVELMPFAEIRAKLLISSNLPLVCLLPHFHLGLPLLAAPLDSAHGGSVVIIIRQLKPPRVTTFQAVEQAASMVDRFDRMFMRALRQLRDLRRYMPTVLVQHAEQVNVSEQQLNITSRSCSKI
jgi:hypothetical protein